jgi:ribosomal protein L13
LAHRAPGGIKGRTPAETLAGKFPERVIEKAVERMIPEGPLGRRQFKTCASLPVLNTRMPHKTHKCWILPA